MYPKRRFHLNWWQWLLASIGGMLVVSCVLGVALFALLGLSSHGGRMALGSDYTQDAEGFHIVDPTNQFHALDPFAYVITLTSRIGTTNASLILVSEGSSGAETVVYSTPFEISNPDNTSFANRIAATVTIMGHSPSGDYKLEMSDGSHIVASANFTYLG